ncbi:MULTISPECIES: restriction endonuclease subunit S [Delftia]|uniref:restriction endonuclease subunit S n=1 Tax=Delftia TaxID=80865 RepID=UPI000B0171A6|nr:restriction endonuclease subunit S [Delftia lacustris]
MTQATHHFLQNSLRRLIASDWKLGVVGDFVAELNAGVSVNAVETEGGCAGDEVGVLKSGAVLRGKFFPEQHKVVVPADRGRVATSVRADRIILSRMNTPALVGESGYVEEDAPHLFLPDRLWQTEPSNEPHSQRWLSYWLQHPAVRALIVAAATGTSNSMKNISKETVLSLPVPRTPLAEQTRIAAILTAVDDKLDVIARQIEATQTLKQGLMQTLFSRGVGTKGSNGTWAPHTHLHHIDGRELPRAWGAATLGAYIAELRSGVSVNAEDRVCRPGEIGVLKVSSVQDGRFFPSNHKTVVPMELDRVAEPVQEGCIIISRANTPALVGESAYVVNSHPELFLPDKLWQTRPTDSAHSARWLAFYLQSPGVRQEVRKAATGTSGSMKNISKASLLNIFMPLVPLEEQLHIAELLGAITSKIEALEEKDRHYQSLKRGLMQKLLTGEWRVKIGTETAT